LSLDVTMMLMGICPPQRLKWLGETKIALDNSGFPFVKKILAIDEFGGYKFPNNLYQYFVNSGWDVLIESCASRVEVMTHALKLINSEYTFYHEDDVLPRYLPTIYDLKTVFEIKYGDRECGMISLTLGGCQFDASSGNIGDLEFLEENAIVCDSKYKIFLRLEKYKNDWFFEFPGLFIRTDLFRSCHDYACRFLSGMGIEQALTKAYFDMGYNYKYFKCSVALPDALKILKRDPSLVNSHCRLLHNLDVNQGSGIGSRHTY